MQESCLIMRLLLFHIPLIAGDYLHLFVYPIDELCSLNFENIEIDVKLEIILYGIRQNYGPTLKLLLGKLRKVSYPDFVL